MRTWRVYKRVLDLGVDASAVDLSDTALELCPM